MRVESAPFAARWTAAEHPAFSPGQMEDRDRNNTARLGRDKSLHSILTVLLILYDSPKANFSKRLLVRPNSPSAMGLVQDHRQVQVEMILATLQAERK